MPLRKKPKTDTSAISGLTAWFTTPYIIAAIIILTAWLTKEGYLPLQKWVWIAATILALGVILVQKTFYLLLLNHHISGPGCLAGLYTYGASLLLCGILFWQGGLEGLIIGVLLVPFLALGVAVLITVVGVDKPGNSTRRSKQKGRR